MKKKYERTRVPVPVIVGTKVSDDFEVKTEIRKGSALNSFLFILVIELKKCYFKKKSKKEPMSKIMFVGDLEIIGRDEEEL